jgi:hypothetical protein
MHQTSELPRGLEHAWLESERALGVLMARLGMDREGLGRLAARARARLPVSRALGRTNGRPAARRGIHV